jgi:hypothetical protein
MSYKYEFHEEVSNDYIDAYTWYESAKRGLGERVFIICPQKDGSNSRESGTLWRKNPKRL